MVRSWRKRRRSGLKGLVVNIENLAFRSLGLEFFRVRVLERGGIRIKSFLLLGADCNVWLLKIWV